MSISSQHNEAKKTGNNRVERSVKILVAERGKLRNMKGRSAVSKLQSISAVRLQTASDYKKNRSLGLSKKESFIKATGNAVFNHGSKIAGVALGLRSAKNTNVWAKAPKSAGNAVMYNAQKIGREMVNKTFSKGRR